jgi:hypothetical protein
LTSAGDRDAANEIRYLGRVSGTLAFSFAGVALLDNCASSEATWAHLVFRRRSRPALASDRDQLGIHRVLQRSRTHPLDWLAEIYLFRGGIVGGYPIADKLPGHLQAATTPNLLFRITLVQQPL